MCFHRSGAASGLLFLLLGLGGSAGVSTVLSDKLQAQEPGQAADQWNKAALEWVAFLKAGAFDSAAAKVAPEVPEGAMGAAELETIWGQLAAQLGALKTIEQGTVTEQAAYHIVDMPAVFENQEVVVRVVLSDALLVSGFFIRPPTQTAYQPPPYADEASFTEADITVGGEPWALPGTLTRPNGDGPFPAVVLVHGSGPNDRDETIGPNRPFRDLAWGLATAGVAVLRYDKRTRVYGGSLPEDIGLDEEVTQDALAALQLARTTSGIDPNRVFLLGHSLGGMMAPEIARQDGALAGVAILAAPARPPLDVIMSQFEYQTSLVPDPGSPARQQLDSLIAVVSEIQARGWKTGQSLIGAPAAYWQEWDEIDPVSIALELTAPLFVIQGGRDYQSTPQDLEIWKAAFAGKSGFTAKLYPDLNHLFASGVGTATPEEYVTEAKPVDPEVIQDLARWFLESRIHTP
jgi:dienelactone hydrolase